MFNQYLMYFSLFRHGKQTANYFSRGGARNWRESAVRPGILSSDWSSRASGRRLWCWSCEPLINSVKQERATEPGERERQRELDRFRVGAQCARSEGVRRTVIRVSPAIVRESLQYQEYPETVFSDFIQSFEPVPRLLSCAFVLKWQRRRVTFDRSWWSETDKWLSSDSQHSQDEFVFWGPEWLLWPDPRGARWWLQIPDRSGRSELHEPLWSAPAQAPSEWHSQLWHTLLTLQGLLPLQLTHRLGSLQVNTDQKFYALKLLLRDFIKTLTWNLIWSSKVFWPNILCQ